VNNEQLALTASAIAAIQLPDGAIPWGPGRHVDPWNHIEAAMGLDATGFHHEARSAYEWLRRVQAPDGTWPAAIDRTGVVDASVDANFCAYIATGVWHHFLSTSDEGWLASMWPCVESAIDAVLDMQLPNGAVAWARDTHGRLWPDALLTSTSCIHLSLWCALSIAARMEVTRPDWELSLSDMRRAIESGDAFIPKARYAMDHYYPVLGLAVRGRNAFLALDACHRRFVIEGKGALCTDDRTWVTTGETCELGLAYLGIGEVQTAAILFEWIQHLRDADGLYWTGANHPGAEIWPDEKTTWSAGSVLLLADALAGGVTRGLFDGSMLVPVEPMDASTIEPW
jgi:hypothetical protein